MHARARLLLLLLLPLAACGGGGAGDTTGPPDGMVAYESGAAELTLSGHLSQTVQLDLSILGTNDYGGQDGEALMSASYGTTEASLSIDLEWTPASAEPSVVDVTFDLDEGITYVGQDCTATSAFEGDAISGTYACPSFEQIQQGGASPAQSLSRAIAAKGSFSASP